MLVHYHISQRYHCQPHAHGRGDIGRSGSGAV